MQLLEVKSYIRFGRKTWSTTKILWSAWKRIIRESISLKELPDLRMQKITTLTTTQ